MGSTPRARTALRLLPKGNHTELLRSAGTLLVTDSITEQCLRIQDATNVTGNISLYNRTGNQPADKMDMVACTGHSSVSHWL